MSVTLIPAVNTNRRGKDNTVGIVAVNILVKYGRSYDIVNGRHRRKVAKGFGSTQEAHSTGRG